MTFEEKMAKMDSLLLKWMIQWRTSFLAENPSCDEDTIVRAFLHSLHYGLYKYPMDRGIAVTIPELSSEDIETIHSIR